MIFSKNITKACLYGHLPKEDEVWAYWDCALDVIDVTQFEEAMLVTPIYL